MYRILIFRFISSHHNKLFHFLWPVLWKPGKSPWYWGRQRQKGGDLATVCGVSAENQPRTRCESHSRYISQNIGRDVQFDTLQVLFNFFLAERTLELFFNLIQLFFNSFVPELKLKVLFNPIQFFSWRTLIGSLTRNSVHRAWSTSPSLSTSKRRQSIKSYLKSSK